MAETKPSQVMTTLLTELRERLADPTALEPFQARAAALHDIERAEWHRAFASARWATKVAAGPSGAFIGGIKKAVEVVREVEKTVGGELSDLLEIPFGWSVSPGFELEITWVFEALRAADAVAAEQGWDKLPWRDLLEAVIAIPD